MSPAAEELELRAAQARRIAEMLSPSDADILRAFAEECEAEAMRVGERKLPIAA
jgi:hypothetical protein